MTNRVRSAPKVREAPESMGPGQLHHHTARKTMPEEIRLVKTREREKKKRKRKKREGSPIH